MKGGVHSGPQWALDNVLLRFLRQKIQILLSVEQAELGWEWEAGEETAV